MSEPRTIEEASLMVGIERARTRLLATALADALVESRLAGPQACARIVQILEPARDRHLRFLSGSSAV